MSGSIGRYLLVMVLVALVVLLGGLIVVRDEGRDALLAGVGVALVAQGVTYALLAGVFFPGRRVAIYAVGMLVRVAVVLWMLFAAERLFGVPVLPAVMSLLLVLFLTTLLEPVFSTGDSKTGS